MDKQLKLIFEVLNEKKQQYNTAYTSYQYSRIDIFKTGWVKYQKIQESIDYLYEKLGVFWRG